LLTGRIPSQHGVHDWLRAGNSVSEPEREGRLIEYLKGQTAYTDLLAAEGYVCGLSGKWHLGDCHHTQKGFTYWKVHTRGGGSYYNAPLVKDEASIYFEPRYVTDVFTDNAIAFLDGQAGSDAPFYLSLHYTAPHSPWGREQHPPELFNDYFDNCPFESVPDEPKHPNARFNQQFFDERGRRREWLSGYYASIEAMDAGVGRVLDWLERADLRQNTLVFFLSDNGMNMGHHGVCGKGNGTHPLNMFDTSVKVPAIVSRPGHVPAGLVAEGLYSQHDFMPTLLEYLDIPNPDAERLPGRSFAALLRDEDDAGQDEVVVFDEYGPTRMIRTRDWKYVHRYPDGPHELYDLRNDPDERENRIGEPDQAHRVSAMRGRLEEWFRRYVVPETDGARKAVDGWGQLDLAMGEGDDAESFAHDWPQQWWREGYEPPGASR